MMSEGYKCNRFKPKNCKMNIVDYLSNRSIKGFQNDSEHYSNKLLDTAKDLYKKDLTAHFGCVNAIEFSDDGNLLFSGGDDRRVLMWNVNNAIMYYTGKMGDGAKPFVMKGCHYSNIFCLAVDDEHKKVLSGGNDNQVIVHDCTTGSPVDIFLHDSPVFSLSLYPSNGNIFASAADNGRILMYDIRESNADPICIAKLRAPFHGVMFNPNEPSLIATANSKVGVHIWDLRKPKEVLIKCNDEPSMAVRWNQNGSILLALRNHLPIVIYDPLVPKKKLEFDSGTYFNACTMKSCSFSGIKDEYILSGSDDFNLYMWKIPDPWPESKWVGSEHLALTGHRSIVNHVRYSHNKQLIATSGVEKIIKLWSPFRLPYSEGDRDKPSTKRQRVLCFSRSCPRSSGFLSHDYSQESVEEDSRMIHFFDSLLQNELEDMTLLPSSQSLSLDSNSFTVPSIKKETRTYEKLIRKKKKYLSKILIEKSNENKLVCSLNSSSNCDRRQKVSFLSSNVNQYIDSLGDNTVNGNVDGNRIHLAVSNSPTSLDNATPSTASFPAQLPSSGKFTNTSLGATVSRSSHSNSDRPLSELSSSLKKSKSFLPLNYSDSDDSSDICGSNSSINFKVKVNFQDSGIQLSETSDSDQVQPCTFFKRKRSIASRTYRNSSRRKQTSNASDSSDSELINQNNKQEISESNNISSRQATESKISDPSDIYTICPDTESETSTLNDSRQSISSPDSGHL